MPDQDPATAARCARAARRYEEAAHAVQAGVAMDPRSQAPGYDRHKHLRTGLDMRAADMMGLVKLLMAKGIITELEYVEAMAEAAEAEKARYEAYLTEHLGMKITLV